MLLIDNNSNLHRRICKVGLYSHDLPYQADLVASTSLDTLLHTNTTYNKGKRYVWLVLDGFTLYEQYNELIARSLQANAEHNLIIDIMSVGNLGGLLDDFRNPFGGSTQLLYQQDVLAKIIHSAQTDSSLNRAIKYSYLPRSFYFASDILKYPSGALKFCSPNKRVVFAGQDGRYSARHSLLFLKQFHLTEEFGYVLGGLDSTPAALMKLIEFSCKTLALITDIVIKGTISEAAAKFILGRSLSRLIILQRLRQESWFSMVEYPLNYLNICSWPQMGGYYILDLGGINGTELFYPRSVDLAINRVNSLRPSMPPINKLFFSEHSLLDHAECIVDELRNSLGSEPDSRSYN